ncbi:uncharacterized protein K452DRAFT_133351 [Aplosporella prunicola CBS 121167]|uniref:Uncharacterized protein n=1 Tax=Aplosporella prunicola CBS 121167 TaxID=1176127 RepID=A0A6A6BQX8_9PEZI|nr:uncharacterized protein K452DRAFT_133351 [Aplosporella prunicola CBS 121167]KAF2144991.1 hypothetical protein K452DRAFT_133351 [Aplosporella prunicola CBS 121167]
MGTTYLICSSRRLRALDLLIYPSIHPHIIHLSPHTFLPVVPYQTQSSPTQSHNPNPNTYTQQTNKQTNNALAQSSINSSTINQPTHDRNHNTTHHPNTSLHHSFFFFLLPLPRHSEQRPRSRSRHPHRHAHRYARARTRGCPRHGSAARRLPAPLGGRPGPSRHVLRGRAA